MEPGDIVIGRPRPTVDRKNLASIFTLNHENRPEEIWEPIVSVYSHKEAYLIRQISGSRFIRKNYEPFRDFVYESFDYKKIKGMIVDFDTMNSKRPHIDGLAAVLIEDKIWWIEAKNLQVIKLGRGQ